MNKILVLSQYYEPDITAASNRVADNVHFLRNNGYIVHVVTSTPHKNPSTKSSLDEVDTTRVWVPTVRRNWKVAYLVQYLAYIVGAFAAMCVLKLKGTRFTHIWATSPPISVAFAAFFAKTLFRAKLVFDIRDMWPQSIRDVGMAPENSLIYRVALRLEKEIYGNSAAITCVSNTMKEHIADFGGQNVTTVFNGPSSDDFETAYQLSQEIESDPDLFVYCGNIGKAQKVDRIIEAFAHAKKDTAMRSARLNLIGGGAELAQCQSLAMQLDITESVRFYGPLPKKEALKQMAGAGVLVVTLKPSLAFNSTIPSKVFDSLSLNRPILHNLTGEAAKILQLSEASIYSGLEDLDLLAGAFISVRKSQRNLLQLAMQNRSILEPEFLRETNGRKLFRLFSR